MYLEKQRVDGRYAIITGGGGGIGYCTAEALCEAGAAGVALADVNLAKVEEVAGTLRAKGYKIEAVELDVGDSAAITAAADRLNKDFGPVDILVANAGITGPDTGCEDMSDEFWQKMIDIDLTSVFTSTRAFGKHMLARGKGSIIASGSMSGIVSNCPQRQSNYNAAKAGVHMFVKSVAAEWAMRGVRINATAPGYVNTPMSNIAFKDPSMGPIWMSMSPTKRMVEPEEVASLNLFLASDASSGMTGAVVSIDLGYTVW
jgi:Dehydrogenases with different specificities (related to short-chain alcohol dehydrogenases)